MENEKVYQMKFAKIYELLVNKAVRKDRTKEEVDEIIRWLTGYKQEELDQTGEQPVRTEDFQGCAFYSRCPYAKEICKKQAPEFREVEPGHKAACHCLEK